VAKIRLLDPRKRDTNKPQKNSKILKFGRAQKQGPAKIRKNFSLFKVKNAKKNV
jgi:hypothetical protein